MKATAPGYTVGVKQIHRITMTRMIGEVEDELATVVCACGWESPRTWFCEDSISVAFEEYLRTLATTLQHGDKCRLGCRTWG